MSTQYCQKLLADVCAVTLRVSLCVHQARLQHKKVAWVPCCGIKSLKTQVGKRLVNRQSTVALSPVSLPSHDHSSSSRSNTRLGMAVQDTYLAGTHAWHARITPCIHG
jgi:hypothetical protein